MYQITRRSDQGGFLVNERTDRATEDFMSFIRGLPDIEDDAPAEGSSQNDKGTTVSRDDNTTARRLDGRWNIPRTG